MMSDYVNDVRMVVLTDAGSLRVLNSQPGMTFYVDSSIASPNKARKPNMHVRDYRYKNDQYPPTHGRHWFCIWALAQEDYVEVHPEIERCVGHRSVHPRVPA